MPRRATVASGQEIFGPSPQDQEFLGSPLARATLSPYVPHATRVSVGNNAGICSDLTGGSALTSMHGPGGTRGNDARSLDRGETSESELDYFNIYFKLSS